MHVFDAYVCGYACLRDNSIYGDLRVSWGEKASPSTADLGGGTEKVIIGSVDKIFLITHHLMSSPSNPES